MEKELEISQLLDKCAEKLLPRKIYSSFFKRPIYQYVQKHRDLLTKLEYCKQQVSGQPLKPELHCQLADVYAGLNRWFPAIAEYRTGLALSKPDHNILLALAGSYVAIGQLDSAIAIYEDILSKTGDIDQKINELLSRARTAKCRPLDEFDHNVYFRLKTLADRLLDLFPVSKFSVLDVGGGEGMLSLFIPRADYVLAEPGINGLSGTALPFEDKSFDVIVACHVLEHVQVEDREQFLDQLCSKARKYVVILNPFYEPKCYVEEQLKIIVELTNAQWAKEHLNCGLPKLEEVEQFAQKRKYGCKIWPNGSLLTSLAMVFVEHYAALAGRKDEIGKLNYLYNELFFDQLTNPQFPTAQMVEFDVHGKYSGKI